MPFGSVIVNFNDSSDRTLTGITTYDRASGGTLVIPAGSAFPGSPVAGELFWRTDTATLYRRNDGDTAWEAVAGGSLSDGDKGDITVSGAGTVWTINGGVVTFAKIQDLATDRLMGRDTAGTGSAEEISVGGGLEFTGSAGIQRSALTGDVTAAAGSNATTIAPNAVGNTKLAQMPASTIKGNNTGIAADPLDLTTAQVTAMLDLFTSTLKGLAPASGGGTANFLRADGSWAAPPQGPSDGDKGDITVAGSGTVWTIDAAVVTFAKMQDLTTDRLMGRDTAGTGSPEQITVGGGLEFTGSGGIQRSALTGDVTAAAGSNATTIENGVVSLAKMANIATSRFIGRTTAGTGVPEALSASQATALLDVFTTTLKGLAPASGGGTTNFLRADGTWAAPTATVADGDKGDITVSSSGTVWTIDPAVVTLAKMADLATARFIGRTTAGTGVPEALTTAQATALLDLFTSGLKGLVPASGGGTTNFLRADGTWAAPSGGGNVTASASLANNAVVLGDGGTTGIKTTAKWSQSGNDLIATASDASVAKIKNVRFAGEYDNGNSGTAKTIDWNNGQKQKVTMTGNCTFTFTALTDGVATLLLKVVQDATGGRTSAWPASVKWKSGPSGNLPAGGASQVDFVSLYYDGTNYYATYLQSFS